MIMSELCMVKEVSESLCFGQVIGWEGCKWLCICPLGWWWTQKRDLGCVFCAPGASLQSPVCWWEEGDSELCQPWQTRAAPRSLGLCRPAGSPLLSAWWESGHRLAPLPHLNCTQGILAEVVSWENLLSKIPPRRSLGHDYKSTKGLWKSHSDLCGSSACSWRWLRKVILRLWHGHLW